MMIVQEPQIVPLVPCPSKCLLFGDGQVDLFGPGPGSAMQPADTPNDKYDVSASSVRPSVVSTCSTVARLDTRAQGIGV